MVFWNTDRLTCLAPECGAEVLVVKAPAHEVAKPRCACGGEMKKIYRSPELRILDESERDLRLKSKLKGVSQSDRSK